MRKFYKYFGTCYLGPMLGMWVSVNPKRLVFFILFLFVTSTFAESSIDEKEDSCSGSIVSSGKNGISVNIEAVVHKECFFTTEIHHYYIRNEDGVVFIKVAPPTKKIQSDEGSVSISHKKGFKLKNLVLDRNLNLLIPWNDLDTTKKNSSFEKIRCINSYLIKMLLKFFVTPIRAIKERNPVILLDFFRGIKDGYKYVHSTEYLEIPKYDNYM